MALIFVTQHQPDGTRKYDVWRPLTDADWDRFLRLTQPEHSCGYLVTEGNDHLENVPAAQRDEFFEENGGEYGDFESLGLPAMLEANARPLDDDAWLALERAAKNPVKRSVTMAKKTKETPQVEPGTGPRTRFKPDAAQKIKVVATSNPRRKTSKTYEAFNIYKNGMTVDAFKQAGGKLLDLKADVDRGHVTLED